MRGHDYRNRFIYEAIYVVLCFAILRLDRSQCKHFQQLRIEFQCQHIVDL